MVLDFALPSGIADALDPRDIATGDAIAPMHLGAYAGRPGERPRAVLYPRTTAQVSAVLRACHAAGIPVVTQGGMTGLVGGALPEARSVVLSTARMTRIEAVDPVAGILRVEAGAALETVQTAAHEAGLGFPLDIGSRGSATIGGLVATNAGGIHVLRYGMMRSLVLGLEVVLADGTVLSDMSGLLKNNTGPDLKQLFIGSEGILGVVTRAVLRLHPRPGVIATACCALDDFAGALALLSRARSALGETLSAFEAMWPDFFALGSMTAGSPFAQPAGLYVLIEAEGSDPALAERLLALLETAMEDGLVRDAVIPHSEATRRALWAIREPTEVYRRHFTPSAGFDVALPLDRIDPFRTTCDAALKRHDNRLQTIWYGHVADNNLHLGVKLPADGGGRAEVDRIVYDAVRDNHGSVSAEHGIGTARRAYLGHSRSPAEIATMRTLKAALDPRNILNPGKVL